MNSSIVKLSWEKFGLETEDLISFINDSLIDNDIKYDLIMGIARGGLPISISLSHKLNCNYGFVFASVTENNMVFAKKNQKVQIDNMYVKEYKSIEDLNILLIDDICKTGKTIRGVIKLLEKYNPRSIDITVLYSVHKTINSRKVITKNHIDPNTWVKFPWEY